MDAPTTDDCRWPPLPARYAAALREAVAFVRGRFDPLGIIATGTIVRGAPHASSDLDLMVIHAAPARQRLQRVFGGVPAEIFVNPPAAVHRYFAEEHADGRPCTAHMIATGAVVLARDPVVDALRAEAAEWLRRRSDLGEEARVRARYAIASRVEDATDVAAADPATALMLLGAAVPEMLHYRCRLADGLLPREKELLARVAAIDADVGAMARRFFSDAPAAERVSLALALADRIVGARGFFEWESGLEPVREASGEMSREARP